MTDEDHGAKSESSQGRRRAGRGVQGSEDHDLGSGRQVVVVVASTAGI